MTSSPRVATTVDELIIPPVLAGARDASAERAAFLSLFQVLTAQPEVAVQRLVEVAMALTGSDSAGVSLQDEDGPEALLRWVAVAGAFSPYLNGTVPLHTSPCGTTVSRASTVIMRDPHRFFSTLSGIQLDVRATLMVPFPRGGRLVGTLWVASGDANKTYSVHDARIVESLLTFSSSILEAHRARRRLGLAG